MATTYQAASAAPTSRALLWAGWILSGAMVAFMGLDGAMKFFVPEMIVPYAPQSGWPASVALFRTLGAIVLGSTLLYAIPRTAVLGAILLTGFLGGAVATHVRIGDPLAHTLSGVVFGALIWLGLWLRDPRVRALLI